MFPLIMLEFILVGGEDEREGGEVGAEGEGRGGR